MDIILALLPWTIIWKLTMRKMDKIGVAICMSMGIVLVVSTVHNPWKPPSSCQSLTNPLILSSAGIIGIVKTSKFPAMLSPDFGAELPVHKALTSCRN